MIRLVERTEEELRDGTCRDVVLFSEDFYKAKMKELYSMQPAPSSTAPPPIGDDGESPAETKVRTSR